MTLAATSSVAYLCLFTVVTMYSADNVGRGRMSWVLRSSMLVLLINGDGCIAYSILFFSPCRSVRNSWAERYRRSLSLARAFRQIGVSSGGRLSDVSVVSRLPMIDVMSSLTDSPSKGDAPVIIS